MYKFIKRIRNQLALLRWFVKQYPRRTIFCVCCLLLASALDGLGIAAMLPLVKVIVTPDQSSEAGIGQAVENAFLSFGVEPSIGPLLTFIAVVLTMKSLLMFFAFTQVGYASAQMAQDIRIQLMKSLMQARWEYFNREHAGNFTAAFSHEAQRAANSFLKLCHIISDVIQVSVYCILALLISKWATAYALLIGIFTMFVLSRFVHLARSSGRRQNRLVRSFNKRLIEGLNAMKSIIAMGQQKHVEPMLEQEIHGLAEAQRRSILSNQGLAQLQEPILVIAVVIGFYLLINEWPDRLELLFGISVIFMRTVRRTNALQRGYAALAQQESAFWFLRNLTEEVRAERETWTGQTSASLKKEIKFENVYFKYHEEPVLKDISLTIPANKITAILGMSGSGKTTAVDMVIGLLRPSSGYIYLDGVPMSDVDIYQWRRMIGYVPQDTVMFHDTILHNITMGDPNISRETVEQALEQVHAASFISRLPEGIETIVGERGLRLSGGQRQRLSIARALVRRPSLLILDEATTALDPRTEEDICEVLRNMISELTILTISHQSAMEEIADVIYRVDREGCIHARNGSELVNSVR